MSSAEIKKKSKVHDLILSLYLPNLLNGNIVLSHVLSKTHGTIGKIHLLLMQESGSIFKRVKETVSHRVLNV